MAINPSALPPGHPLRVAIERAEARTIAPARSAEAARPLPTVSVAMRGLARIVIPGTPVAQGRGRAVPGAHGKARIIDPEASRSWKGKAAALMLDQHGHRPPFARPLRVDIDAFWPRPKRLGSGFAVVRPARPDADNVGKAVLDAGNGILWADDAIVVELVVRKWYADSAGFPRVEIVVSEVS